MSDKYSVIEALMSRDGFTNQEAKEELDDMRQRVIEGEDPEDVLFDQGLEPDYMWDLL